MVTYSENIPEAPVSAHMGAQCARIPAGVGHGVAMFVSTRPRMREIGRLFCKSDEELGALGIARHEISRYVYRDILSL